MSTIRFLFMADTHLGFDYPFKPRVKRRRRGDDFFRNFDLILQRAIEEKVDFLVHGGDLFYRSKIPQQLVWMVFQRLFKVADAGIPVYVVPGNHERSNIPHGLLALHNQVHIFEKPQSFTFRKDDATVLLSGFPNDRDHIRKNFPNLVNATGWEEHTAGLKLLCMHQAVDGSRIENFTFRGRRDVADPRDIPDAFDAVLTGHIHKWQILSGEPYPAPVFYPGSIERTSFIERYEKKGYFDFTWSDGDLHHRYIELPSRQMHVLHYDADRLPVEEIDVRLRRDIAKLPPDAVVRLTIEGKRIPSRMNSAYFREILPETMNLTLRFPQLRR